MGFRFRLGPFTFGRTGTRLSLWSGGVGFSTPLSGKGRTFGTVGIGPSVGSASLVKAVLLRKPRGRLSEVRML